MNTQNDILLNPIRMRIVQHMFDKKERTVADLLELMRDVTRTTLYRHINVLVEHNYLIVTKEVKVRGAYERQYTLNLKLLQETPAAESLEEKAHIFLLKLLSDFNSYFKRNENPIADRLFLSSNTLLLSDSEYELFISEIFGVVKKHLNLEPNQERKQRILSIISSPSWNKDEKNDEE